MLSDLFLSQKLKFFILYMLPLSYWATLVWAIKCTRVQTDGSGYKWWTRILVQRSCFHSKRQTILETDRTNMQLKIRKLYRNPGLKLHNTLSCLHLKNRSVREKNKKVLLSNNASFFFTFDATFCHSICFLLCLKDAHRNCLKGSM